MIINFNTEVLTSGLLIPSENELSTRSVIDPKVVNTLIIYTRIEILYLRQTRVSSTKDSSVMFISKCECNIVCNVHFDWITSPIFMASIHN